MGSIRVLDETVSRRIAAGEVIDRPAAVVRELMDNALDAGARSIGVTIEGGGIDLVAVTDDGCGMDREDLGLCALEHATSKLRTVDDLDRIRSLGFRGEALSSIAAVSSLLIRTRTESETIGWELALREGIAQEPRPCGAERGTTVEVRGLFDAIPARKRFLKRPQAEAAVVRQVFRDRAAAWPEVRFRFSSGETTEALLPSSLVERVRLALASAYPVSALRELAVSGEHFRGVAVACDPSWSRTDRRDIATFVNRRRITEYSLMKSLELGYSTLLPGGRFPAAWLFLDVDPAHVDFNVHPAKREAKIRILDEIREAVIRTLRAAWSSSFRLASLPPDAGSAPDLGLEPVPAIRGYAAPEIESARDDWRADGTAERGGAIYASPIRTRPNEETPSAAESPAEPGRDWRYLGPALGVFQLFSSAGSLVLMDQHAAHERILYDLLVEKRPDSQELLVPVAYECADDGESSRIDRAVGTLSSLGFALAKNGQDWLIEAAPAMMSSDAAAIREAVAKASSGSPDALRHARASVACRSAVKDGDVLDPGSARSLFDRALALPEQRCPHGRPIFVVIDRRELLKRVGRIV